MWVIERGGPYFVTSAIANARTWPLGRLATDSEIDAIEARGVRVSSLTYAYRLGCDVWDTFRAAKRACFRLQLHSLKTGDGRTYKLVHVPKHEIERNQ